MNAVLDTRLRLSSGACEALKWLALASMIVDHVNTVFFARGVEWATPAGRLAFPLFAIVVGYNLARPKADLRSFALRALAIGILAQPFHTVLFAGSWLPFNVLFTFAAAAAVIVASQSRSPWRYGMLAMLAAVSIFVDYGPVGVFLTLASYAFFRGVRYSAALFVVALAGLCLLNGNPWAVLAFPLVAIAAAYAPHVPRLRWFFWAFYPVHLALLWACQLFGGVGDAPPTLTVSFL